MLQEDMGSRRNEEKQDSWCVAEPLYGWDKNRRVPGKRTCKKCLVFKWKEFTLLSYKYSYPIRLPKFPQNSDFKNCLRLTDISVCVEGGKGGVMSLYQLRKVKELTNQFTWCRMGQPA